MVFDSVADQILPLGCRFHPVGIKFINPYFETLRNEKNIFHLDIVNIATVFDATVFCLQLKFVVMTSQYFMRLKANIQINRYCEKHMIAI